jgi:hypothetical protein
MNSGANAHVELKSGNVPTPDMVMTGIVHDRKKIHEESTDSKDDEVISIILARSKFFNATYEQIKHETMQPDVLLEKVF